MVISNDISQLLAPLHHPSRPQSLVSALSLPFMLEANTPGEREFVLNKS